ncbi:hypothetical protein BB560_000056 [Smittium megazygosporum]|uniref:Zinc finger C2H2 LYAR-type domain-containing protein n=1 Tax=Smittium megazygosporum TaxID=133381 RepID=A0A2T9ZLE9_9FUNG|nr:hypothetical protein BB560_000056 [Smittium megazygosporum]
MVSFVCNHCQETIKKPKLDFHKQRCRFASFSCIDCGVDFQGVSYRDHTSCISENEKYMKKLYQPKNNNKEQTQQSNNGKNNKQQKKRSNGNKQAENPTQKRKSGDLFLRESNNNTAVQLSKKAKKVQSEQEEEMKNLGMDPEGLPLTQTKPNESAEPSQKTNKSTSGKTDGKQNANGNKSKKPKPDQQKSLFENTLKQLVQESVAKNKSFNLKKFESKVLEKLVKDGHSGIPKKQIKKIVKNAKISLVNDNFVLEF